MLASRVSAVIPVFNCEKFIGEAIESVFAQTVPPHEVIVVDDGSTDGTGQVLRGFGDRVRVLSQKNRGPSAARNAAAGVATGEWLAFLDADDTWLPAKTEKQLSLGEGDRVGIVYSDRFNIGARGTLPEVHGQIQHLYSGDVFLDLLLLGNHITASSVMIRKDVFAELGGFDDSVVPAEDWDLWIRVAQNYLVAACREPLVCYRFHGGMASLNPQRMLLARTRVIQRALNSERGMALKFGTRRGILGTAARTNAWDAARNREHRLALSQYVKAFAAAPWQAATYSSFARFVLGRHV